MNAATRVQAQSVYIARRNTTLQLSWQTLAVVFLLLTVFASAFALVYTRDYQRQLVMDLQGLQMQRDSMVSQRSQLLLEQAAWSTETRVAQTAEHQLGMVLPTAQTLVLAQAD